MGLRHQALQIVDETRATVLGILVVPADVDRLLRAHLLAVAAEDAAEFIDLEDERIPIPLLVLPRHELDAVGGAHGRTQTAGDALRLPRLGGQHAMRSPPPGRELPLLVGILERDLVRVDEMLEGERHSLERRANVADLLDRPLEHLHRDRHQSPDSGTRGERALRERRRAIPSSRTRALAGLISRPRSSSTKTRKSTTMFMPNMMRPNRQSRGTPAM